MLKNFVPLVAIATLSYAAPALAGTTATSIKAENEAIEKKCSSGTCSTDDLKKFDENSNNLEKVTEKFRFGVAIGFEDYKDSYVNDATTIGATKIVKINDVQARKPTFWLETHYVWDGIASEKLKLTHSAPGFYVGVRLAGPDSEVFDAFSLGALWSFKRTAIGTIPPAGQVAESINIGVGPVWHRTRTLAKGIVEGQPLPAMYNQIEYDKRDEVSWMLMVSAGF